MKLENSSIAVEIDALTGATSGLYYLHDPYKMNWILENSSWGLTNGFQTESIDEEKNKVTVTSTHKKLMLSVKIEKEISDNGYLETYCITNCGDAEFFMTKENFGIPVPYSCNYSDMRKVLNERCINHVWCGGDSSWLYSVKANGEKPYLVMNTVQGAIDDYSIKYDISRTINGSFYRGEIVLHPREQIICPNETLTYKFMYSFSEDSPEFASLKADGAIRFSADKYTLKKNEEVTLKLECAEGVTDASVYCDGKALPCHNEKGTAICHIKFDASGEKKITAQVNGKKTWLFLNVCDPVSEILEKRARFISEKQQYHREGSCIDGAYLIYDNETKSLYFEAGDNDHNACRERLCLGIVVCKALQKKYDEKMMDSLKKHRNFIEREIFDEESGEVYGNVGKKSGHPRIFNYPWVSVYYLEWYELTKEKKCLENSVKILMRFFDLAKGGNSAQCIEAVRVYNALKEEKMDSLAETFSHQFMDYVKTLGEKQGIGSPSGFLECSWCSEVPCGILCYCAQAYILSGDKKFLDRAEKYDKMAQAFFAYQPDFHMNCITVRYWDNYWFGKYACYGDVFPHYWSSLIGWAYAWYDKAKKANAHTEIIKSNLTGNLCVYNEDGSAYNNYLYPYKVELYSSVPGCERKYLKPQTDYGKRYDAWSNDQDWAIYYASQFLK